jgi:hypothetical protein
MKSLNIPARGEDITGDWLASLGECILELQQVAILKVQGPLWLYNRTLGATGAPEVFWAKVEQVSTIASHATKGFAVQWKYKLDEVRFDGTGYEIVTGGRTCDGATDFALNAAELTHPGSDIIFGVDVTGADYPPGFKPIPLAGVVRVRVERDKNGAKLRLFDRQGTHDGTCKAPTT